MREIGHFIGGKNVKGISGRTADVYQPMTGEVIAKVALASKKEMREAVENAKAAQISWAATNPQRRARVMFKFLELIAKETDTLAELLAREHGKTIPDAKGDIQRGVEVIEFACGIPHLMKGEYTESAGTNIDLYSMRQPLGVVAGITPFNFPAMIPMWKFGPAIACGNAFILKPSERDPGVPMRLAELMIEAGLPAGILNVVNGDKEAVDAILDDPDIKAVGFVGSTPIAEYVYTRGTAHGKRVQCFGGAKNHMIVMPDADMDQAVDALIGAGYGAAGERCMAISVAVPVGEKTADALVKKLVPRVESLKIGPSTSADADYGPMITKAHLEKVKSYVDIGIKEGAQLKVDGRNFKMQGYENGFYMGGCLFDNVTRDMRIYKEEIFGPVLSVVRAKDYEEAIDLPTSHEYGNGVSIFTRDGDAARDFASKVEVGMVGINFAIPVPLAYHTFGGWKRSGFGDLNQHGPDSIRFYTRTKTVTARWPSGTKAGSDFSHPDDEVIMAEYQLYCFAQSGNAYRVALMLNLTGADWEPVWVDQFKTGEPRTPAFRAEVNEMGEAPVLAFGERKLSQSGVILTYLADKFKSFQPKGVDEQLECLRWLLFDNQKVGGFLGPYRFVKTLSGKPDPGALNFLKPRIDNALGIVNARLKGRKFLLGEQPTIADISVCGYMYYPADEYGFDIPKDYPAIGSWLERIKALRGWEHPYKLMPGYPLVK